MLKDSNQLTLNEPAINVMDGEIISSVRQEKWTVITYWLMYILNEKQEFMHSSRMQRTAHCMRCMSASLCDRDSLLDRDPPLQRKRDTPWQTDTYQDRDIHLARDPQTVTSWKVFHPHWQRPLLGIMGFRHRHPPRGTLGDLGLPDQEMYIIHCRPP